LEDQISNKDVSNQNGMVSMYYAMRQKKNNPTANEQAENQMLLEIPDKEAKKGDGEKAFTPVLLKSVVKGNQYTKQEDEIKLEHIDVNSKSAFGTNPMKEYEKMENAELIPNEGTVNDNNSVKVGELIGKVSGSG
jgi:hypothetical protein